MTPLSPPVATLSCCCRKVRRQPLSRLSERAEETGRRTLGADVVVGAVVGEPDLQDRDAAARRVAAVVVDDRVRDEELAGGLKPHSERAGLLEIPDDAVLDVERRDDVDLDSAIPDDLPIDHQAAQAD